jgi:hypothetical protein
MMQACDRDQIVVLQERAGCADRRSPVWAARSAGLSETALGVAMTRR